MTIIYKILNKLIINIIHQSLQIVFFFLSYFIQIQDKTVPIARVSDIILTQKDLPRNLRVINDKTKLKQHRYIQEWVKKQLIVVEAKKLNRYNKEEILRNVERYKTDLIAHEFIMITIKNKIKQHVSDNEIEAYYKANIRNFELKKNIVQGRFAVIPKHAKNSNRLFHLFLSSNKEDANKLYDYCKEYAISYFLNPKIWMVFSKFIENTPFANVRDKMSLIRKMKKKKVMKLIGSENIYYFDIHNYKINNDVSPLEFVKNNVKDIIIHKREIELKKKIINDIYNRATKEGEYEIFLF